MGHDVIVVGLGGMGSASAHRLAAGGLRVLGLDRHPPAHDQGSSHGGSRITRQAYFEDPAYVPLLRRAGELWDAVAEESGRHLVDWSGGVMVGRPDGPTISGSLASARYWGLEHELLDAGQIHTRYPTLRPSDADVALVERRAGSVNPEESVRAHLDLAGRYGADLRHGETVLDWTATDAGVRVRTERATHEADRLVLAPGAWAPDLLADLGVPMQIERYVQFWFAPSDPAAFAGHPVYIWEGPGGRQFYGFGLGGDGTVKVAFFRGGDVCDPASIDRTVHPGEVEEIRAFAAPHVPGAVAEFVRAKTCMYTCTPDHHFVIAPHPAHPAVTVACGFSGHGFKFVPVVGEIVADLVTAGSTSHPIDLFDPARFSARSTPAHSTHFGEHVA
ncbi:sarcosine oxidase [Pseudonocardia sediminis]|uniref:Sarcosine oxidase n=1 Tax=Pseudonocardia sediminis TaxID=1397368 RepID=A0A4Q7V133_PSEST|nr:N-methyl-L-tryptophan oxidase [Pseudonocardia sediminis]RZT86293.1 sarcosine oxidase [Pseudonocardia sediminis]